MVGEKHPEWFLPEVGRGRLCLSLGAQTVRPLAYSATYNINTPNADSFRRTQALLLAEVSNLMAMHHARNS